MNLKKYKRFFAFGCSMTSYQWPTWADIMSIDIPDYFNYAKSGGGNLYISNSIVEANRVHKFDKDDLVIVMWSTVTREDRYRNKNWETPGNIYTQSVYDDKWVEKWADERFYFLRDMALIDLSFNYLQNQKCDYHMLQMMPFKEMQYGGTDRPDRYNECDDILELYKDVLNRIKKDILNSACNGKWPNIKIKGTGGQTSDYHPTPSMHLKYLQNSFSGINLSQNAINLVKTYENLVMNSDSSIDISEKWTKENKNQAVRL